MFPPRNKRSIRTRLQRGQVSPRLVWTAAIAAVITLPIAGWALVSLQAAAANRPDCYVKQDSARATMAASAEAMNAARPKMGPWYYVGPFDNTSEKAAEAVYAPEKSLDLQAEYTGKGGQTIKWQKAGRFADNQFNDLRLYNDKDNDYAVTFVYRRIEAQSDMNFDVYLNGDDGINAWLNGEPVIPGRRNVNNTTVTLKLKAGVNHLLLKVWQGWGGYGFTFGLPDPNKQVDDIIAAINEDFPRAEAHELEVDAANRMEWDLLSRQIAGKDAINRFASTTLNPAALIAETDRDPADLVLRRTRALLSDLKQSDPGKNRSAMQARLEALAAKAKSISISDTEARMALYLAACKVRREIAFSNPLLNFDKILFAKHTVCGPDEARGNHMCDQYFGFKATPGGGIFVLNNPFGPAPTVRDVLENSKVKSGRLAGTQLTQQGSYLSPSLSYDGKTILFAYVEKGKGDLWSDEMCYHIFKVGVDGSNLTQLTDGPWNEFDPFFMPNGKIIFISERRGGYGRCHGRPVPVYTLHTMRPDGSDITCISYHESNEWHPSINNQGMVIYSRWDYVDRGFNQAHHPWITTPDGRDARAIHGNYPSGAAKRPWLEAHVRAIPGSHKYTATAGPHHGQAYGSLIMIDPRVPDDDAMGPVRRITPDAAFPEGEDNRRYPYGMVYGTAWGLSEKYYLAAYDPKSAIHGVYLIDCFGNREFLYRDPKLGSLNPVPLRPRVAPPVIPDQVKPENRKGNTGTIAVMNVYDGLKPWPAGTKIKALRIMQVLPKTTPYANGPRIGYGDQKSARAVLGTVPVESDGSAYFVAPAKKAFYFQALDENGLAVQSMRSDTYVQPGEQLTCQGCHNPVTKSPTQTNRSPIAMRRAPSKIKPDVDGSHPFNYPRLVQGVLDKNCVSCHAGNEDAPDLSGTISRENGWTKSYNSLRNYAFFWDNAVEDAASRTTPGEFGARNSRLYKMLSGGHHGLKLPAADMHRLTLWLDSNSDFFGAYEETEKQAKGEVVWPTLD